jgi:hypothetical protein
VAAAENSQRRTVTCVTAHATEVRRAEPAGSPNLRIASEGHRIAILCDTRLRQFEEPINRSVPSRAADLRSVMLGSLSQPKRRKVPRCKGCARIICERLAQKVMKNTRCRACQFHILYVYLPDSPARIKATMTDPTLGRLKSAMARMRVTNPQ